MLACMAGLLLAELAARRAHPDALDEQPQAALARLHRYSEVYGWELRPGARVQLGGQRTTVNRLGQRGAEHTLARARGRRRLVMLGDSIAFGYGVADEETFSARLEREGFEVVNLAVPGYGTDQELIRLEREGVRWQPDTVLLHFCVENDPVDNVSRRFFYDDLHPKPYFLVQDGALTLHDEDLRLSLTARAALWMREHSVLFNLLRPPPAAAREWRTRKARALGDGAQARAVTVLLLARAAQESVAHGASFLLVVHPSLDSFHQPAPWAEAVLHAPLPAGARALDMAAAYKARGLHFRDVTLESIGHLSARGHETTAAVLADALPR